MAFYTLPLFNISFDFWFPGNTPAGGPADGSIDGQLYLNTKFVNAVFSAIAPCIRISTGDLYTWGPQMVGAIFQFIDGNGDPWCYKVQQWEWSHYGFPNQYVTLLVYQCNNNGTYPDHAR